MNKNQYELKSKDLLEKYNVPEKYRRGCLDLAWELGHAYGYNEVYLYLIDIVDRIFYIDIG